MLVSARGQRVATRKTVAAVTAFVAGLGGLAGLVDRPASAHPPSQSAASTAVRTAADGVYLVQLDDAPAAEYAGGLPGIPTTRVAPGQKLLRTTSSVQAYVRHLSTERARVLDAVDGEQKLYDYNYTYAGFSARMSHDAATKLANTPGVTTVVPNELVRADTVDTPRFLGMSGAGGVWDRVGGIDRAGDGVIVGVLDSGFVPERPSFAPIRTSPESNALVARKWRGTCQTGTSGPVTCNNKVIGARYFDAAIGNEPVPQEFRSPRDYGGHGTHTASTAAGNHGVTMTVQGRNYGQGSGMAPHARLAIYKVLWSLDESTANSGAIADIVAAIDAAVADGVDVLNYSVSGPPSTIVDPVGLAFLRAARAGVFVSASAGNAGPGASTVQHNSPWMTTVADGTHDRHIQATVVLGNGLSHTGVGISAGVPSAPLVLSTNAAAPGADPNQARLCAPNTLDPAKVAGKIVLCERGVTDRVDKSKQVKIAGGIGMLLVNPVPGTVVADPHSVPTVHLDHVAGPEVKAYAATVGATATIQEAQTVRVTAPKVSSTSSRGPALAGAGDLLKPDVMAPGTNVLAATTGVLGAGGDYGFLSGTSMAAPHIAGIAAVLRGRYPSWSPMAIKSAIMTTATTTDTAGNPIQNDSGTPGSPFDYGAGQARPGQALDPGLIYDSSYADWTRYVCGAAQVPASDPLCANGSTDPSDLNYPTIAIGAMVGRQVVRRTVVNVGPDPEVYYPKVEGLAGIKATASPRSMLALPGRPVSYTVTFEQVSAPTEQYSFGKLHLRSDKHTVTSALAIRPIMVQAPVEVKGTGASGSLQVPLITGFNGTLSTSVLGLAAATVGEATLRNPTGGPFPETVPAESEHVAKFTVTVPAGTRHARFATFNADHPAHTDLDVFVYRGGTVTQVGRSAGPTADEEINLTNPAAGSYDVYVDLFSGPGPQPVKHFGWAVGDAVGNLTATPANQAVTVAGPASVTATWSGLAPGQRYLGRLLYTGTTATTTTIIRVDA